MTEQHKEYIFEATKLYFGGYHVHSVNGELTRCKDCKHRPRRIEKNGGNWFDLEFPDNRCPCQGDDGRYNWMPDDNWFCGNAERKE